MHRSMVQELTFRNPSPQDASNLLEISKAGLPFSFSHLLNLTSGGLGF